MKMILILILILIKWRENRILLQLSIEGYIPHYPLPRLAGGIYTKETQYTDLSTVILYIGSLRSPVAWNRLVGSSRPFTEHSEVN